MNFLLLAVFQLVLPHGDAARPSAIVPPGFYTLVLEFVVPDGSVNCVRKTDYFKPDGKAPWEGTTLGAEDTVPPPWTRPEFGADGRFACWNRVHKLGGARRRQGDSGGYGLRFQRRECYDVLRSAAGVFHSHPNGLTCRVAGERPGARAAFSVSA